MAEEIGTVGRVTAVLTAAGYSDAHGTGPRARGPEFLVNGGVHAVVTVNWGDKAPKDLELLVGCAAALREAGFEIVNHTGYFTVRDPADR